MVFCTVLVRKNEYNQAGCADASPTFPVVTAEAAWPVDFMPVVPHSVLGLVSLPGSSSRSWWQAWRQQ